MSFRDSIRCRMWLQLSPLLAIENAFKREINCRLLVLVFNQACDREVWFDGGSLEKHGRHATTKLLQNQKTIIFEQPTIMKAYIFCLISIQSTEELVFSQAAFMQSIKSLSLLPISALVNFLSSLVRCGWIKLDRARISILAIYCGRTGGSLIEASLIATCSATIQKRLLVALTNNFGTLFVNATTSSLYRYQIVSITQSLEPSKQATACSWVRRYLRNTLTGGRTVASSIWSNVRGLCIPNIWQCEFTSRSNRSFCSEVSVDKPCSNANTTHASVEKAWIVKKETHQLGEIASRFFSV